MPEVRENPRPRRQWHERNQKGGAQGTEVTRAVKPKKNNRNKRAKANARRPPGEWAAGGGTGGEKGAVGQRANATLYNRPRFVRVQNRTNPTPALIRACSALCMRPCKGVGSKQGPALFPRHPHGQHRHNPDGPGLGD